ncbi:hypothetical protein KJ975_01675 [Myxococcota bacterium]|nr:hypothetical protein [Myxococcota bacterium]
MTSIRHPRFPALSGLVLLLWIALVSCDSAEPPRGAKTARSAPGPTGLCGALATRFARCPAEDKGTSLNSCGHDQRCMESLLRPAAVAEVEACVRQLPCRPEPRAEVACVRQVADRAPRTAERTQVREACTKRAATCGEKLEATCQFIPLMHDSVRKRVGTCLEYLTCSDVDRCLEQVYEAWGCP